MDYEVPSLLEKLNFILQKEEHSQKQESGAVNALQDLYDVMRFDVLHVNMRYFGVIIVIFIRVNFGKEPIL